SSIAADAGDAPRLQARLTPDAWRRERAMESILIPLLQSLVLVPATLLPIINPLGIAPIFAASLGSNRNLASQLARQIAVNSWIIIMVSILTGSYVLALFGISLPVVRIGGGLLVAATAWRMLQSNDDDDVHAAAAAEASEMPTAEVVRRTLFPITFPLTTGPGTIAAAIALGAQIPSTPVSFLAQSVAAAIGATIVALTLYVIFANSARVLAWLGEVG